MASWFTRALDRITPWDRGGEVERRKKREEEQARATQASSNRSQISVRQPQNVFSDQISEPTKRDFNIGLTNVISPNAKQGTPELPDMVPGKNVLKPEVYQAKNQQEAYNQASDIEKRIPKPKQSLVNKFRDQFDANTEADQYRRSLKIANEKATQSRATGMDKERALGRAVSNARIVSKNPYRSGADDVKDFTTSVGRGLSTVPSAIGRTATGVGEGLLDISGFLAGTVPNAGINLLRHGTVSGSSNNAIANANKYIKDKTLSPVSRFMDRTAKVAGGEQNMPFYKGTQIAANVIPIVASGGTLAGTRAANLAEAGDLTKATKWAKIADVLGGSSKETKLSPVIRFLEDLTNRPVRGLGERLGIISKNAPSVSEIPSLGDGSPMNNVLSPSEVDDILKTDIPVRQGVNVTSEPVDGVNIPVRNETKPGNLIHEVGGDAPVETRMPTREELVKRNFNDNPPVRPDGRIEGVSPREPQAPFKLDENLVTQGQDKVIDDYAEMLQSMGEGNGVNFVPVEEGGLDMGYKRISNNVRFGDTKGKRMTKAMWRDEAIRQINEGKADPSIQKMFNDAKDPEIQSLLARGDQPEAPQGMPIKVKQVNPIAVKELDNTDIPANLPEKPGTVRATTATAPAKAEAEAVANQPTTASVQKSEFDEGGLPTTNAETQSKIPTDTTDNPMQPVYEKLVTGLKENQKAQKVEKQINKAEKSRRLANYNRIYDEQIANGVSHSEAAATARAALGGEYTNNTVRNVELAKEETATLFKKVRETYPADKGFDFNNTEKAITHMLSDPTPLQPHERTYIRRFIQKTLGEDAAQSLDEAITVAQQSGDRSAMGRVADFMTSSIASGDISATGRQGLSGWINHPKMSKGAWDDAIKAMMDSNGEKAFAAKLTDNPNVSFIQEQMGGKFLTLSDIADEARGGNTGNRATSWYVNPSNRHYNTYLDSLRLRQKEAIIERYGGQEGFLEAASKANPENPEKWMKAWNKVIDVQSGRGSFSKAGSPTAGDMQVLFSARNLASKFQRLTAPLQLGLLKTNPAAYAYQLKETATQAAVLAGTLGAIKASGAAEIENGKIKIGHTRIDITGGFSTIFKAANDLRKAMGIAHDTSKDNGSFLRSGGTVVTDFLRNQAAPLLGTIGKLADVDFSKGEDKFGNKIDAKWLLNAAPLPNIAQTVINGVTEGSNPVEIARNAALDAVGLNTNTYLSAEDKDNQAREKTASVVNESLSELSSTGLLNDNFVKKQPQEVQDLIKQERQLSEDELKKVKESFVKGIGTEGSDTAYLERGEYDTNIALLKLKKSMIENEPGTKPSSIKDMDTSIKRSEFYKAKQPSTDLIEKYSKTQKNGVSLSEWRAMGDPKSDSYNPDLYQQLWNIDEAMAKAGISYGDEPTKQKYSVKKSGSGSGRGGGGKASYSTQFGKITGSGSNAPKVKEYETMAQASGAVPRIKRTRPNITHVIKESRV